MSNLTIGALSGVLVFICGYIGMGLQKRLPESHMSSGARDMIASVMGLVALLLALVLGTLVGSAYGFFATQKANVETLSARTIQLDMALRDFGAEGAPIRADVHAAMAQIHKAVWLEDLDPRRSRAVDLVANFMRLNQGAAQLQPKTPVQTAALPTIVANVSAIEQTRFLMALQLASPISWPLLAIVVSWAMLLFGGYGVLARLNGTAVLAALVGAFAVGSAVFLILELNSPFSGLFRIPSTAVEQALEAIGG